MHRHTYRVHIKYIDFYVYFSYDLALLQKSFSSFSVSSLSKSGRVKAPKTLELTVLNGKNEKVHYTERNVKF